MIIIFSELSESSLGEALNVAEHHFHEVNENFDYCVKRERAKEILTLRDLGIPYVVLSSMGKRQDAEDPANVIDTNVDLNCLPNQFTVVMRTDKTVHLPSRLAAQPQLLSESQQLAVGHWPDVIHQPDVFLKRAVHMMSHAEFSQRLQAGEVPTPLFIKGVEKGTTELSLHHVFNDQADLDEMFFSVKDALVEFPHLAKGSLRDLDDNLQVIMKEGEPWYCEYRESMQRGRLHLFVPKEGLILSEVLQIEKGPTAKQEFRAFIVNGKVTSLSAYVDYESVPVPDEIRAMAEDFAKANAHIAPAFVADFGVTDRGPVLIEMNDFYRSGRYLDNDPVALYQALAEGHDLGAFQFVAPMPVPDDSVFAQEDDFDFGFMLESTPASVEVSAEETPRINYKFLLSDGPGQP
jgi:hypothetical protein